MTIDSTYNPQPEVINDIREYPFDFEFIGVETIVVYEVDAEDNLEIVPSTRYTVTKDENELPIYQQGIVKWNIGQVHAPSTTHILIERNTPIDQLVDYLAYGPFPAETHEFNLDKITLILQELAKLVGEGGGEGPGVPILGAYIPLAGTVSGKPTYGPVEWRASSSPGWLQQQANLFGLNALLFNSEGGPSYVAFTTQNASGETQSLQFTEDGALLLPSSGSGDNKVWSFQSVDLFDQENTLGIVAIDQDTNLQVPGYVGLITAADQGFTFQPNGKVVQTGVILNNDPDQTLITKKYFDDNVGGGGTFIPLGGTEEFNDVYGTVVFGNGIGMELGVNFSVVGLDADPSLGNICLFNVLTTDPAYYGFNVHDGVEVDPRSIVFLPDGTVLAGRPDIPTPDPRTLITKQYFDDNTEGPSGNFIPLVGTEVDKPVTGFIEIDPLTAGINFGAHYRITHAENDGTFGDGMYFLGLAGAGEREYYFGTEDVNNLQHTVRIHNEGTVHAGRPDLGPSAGPNTLITKQYFDDNVGGGGELPSGTVNDTLVCGGGTSWSANGILQVDTGAVAVDVNGILSVETNSGQTAIVAAGLTDGGAIFYSALAGSNASLSAPDAGGTQHALLIDGGAVEVYWNGILVADASGWLGGGGDLPSGNLYEMMVCGGGTTWAANAGVVYDTSAATNELQVTGSVIGDSIISLGDLAGANITPEGNFLEAGPLGIIATSAYTPASFAPAAHDHSGQYVDLTTTQTINGVKTFNDQAAFNTGISATSGLFTGPVGTTLATQPAATEFMRLDLLQAQFAPISHTHSEYSPTSHNHDGVYSPVSHTHSSFTQLSIGTPIVPPSGPGICTAAAYFVSEAMPAGSGLQCVNTLGIISYDSSDLRFKSNITESQVGLSAIMQMETIDFDWNDDKGGHHDVGFSAQNLVNILPEAVPLVEADDRYGFRQTPILSAAVKAIQEQQAIIDDLTARLEALENG